MRIHYPAQLPITARKDEIIRAVQEHQVVVVAGDTGSGKTTQLPKMCLEAGRAAGRCLIGCTQPRRIAAVSVTERVQEELGAAELVGYKIRFSDRTGPQTRIKFMTDGVLLAETQGDRDLRRYDTLIIDEAHERSLNIDFLLGYLHQLLARRPDLKLLISSATIDTEKFSRHFSDAPIIQVEGRTYPVTMEYCPPGADSDEDDEAKDLSELIIEQVRRVMSKPGGDILIFMPTERDILDTADVLKKQFQDQALVLPLFGRLQGGEQRRIFQPAQVRKIIVATNVAETSITVPGIETVIDTGLARISRYSPRSGTTSLPVTRVSQASCRQRAGRCGRIGPGRCIRLYSEEDFLSRPDFTLPEILRSNLAEVILQMTALHLPPPSQFPFLDPPASQAVSEAYRTLRELGAVTPEHRLTKRGRIMARLPIDPRISRMIIESADLGALREVSIIAAALAIQDPRIVPAEKKEKARQAHLQFAAPGSDLLTLVNIWNACRGGSRTAPTAGELRRFCTANFCSWQRMREWFDIHEQILRILKQHEEFGPALARMEENEAAPAPPEAVHQAITAGFLRNIAIKKEKNTYQITGNREAVIFPGSHLYNKGGQWIVATDFVQTSQLFARMAANIDVSWLERLGGDLCKRSYSDPHWEKKAGQVVALEKVTLFGLIIAANRKVNYGRISQQTAEEARTIFIREALLPGELEGAYPFLQHNLDLLRRLEEMEERLRRRGTITDEQALFDFYDQRLGLVYDRFTLNRFLRNKAKQRQAGGEADAFLRMKEEDVCRKQPDSEALYRFPETLQTPQGRLKLHYCFQPGQEDDGVTVDIPASCCAALSPVQFEWLVPGLLPDKVLALLKSLPKRLRRQLVPLPDAADAILDSLAVGQGSLYPALEQVILRRFQMTVTRADWQLDNLPLHLRMRFRLCDEKGQTLCCTRTFQELTEHCAMPKVSHAKGGAPASSTSKLPSSSGLTSWDFDPPPQPVPVKDGQKHITGLYHPALFLEEKNGQPQSAALRYIPDPEQARSLCQAGLRFLYGLQFPGEIPAINKECKAAVTGQTASWLSLGLKGGAAATVELLRNCILDSLFQLNELDGLPSKAQFAATVAALKEQGLRRQALAMLNQIADLLATRRQVQTVLTQCRQRSGKIGSGQTRFAEYQQLLEGLVPQDFLAKLPLAELPDRKRWLLALAKRIERAEHGPLKDDEKAKRVQPFVEQLRRLMQENSGPRCPACHEELALFRRMTEEFKVSVFAPEIGTALPVSEKRLDAQRKKAEELCRRVE
ncbi:ATP-dependent RNA helicase HrpA [Candidatus Electronema halotolerans]